MPTVETTEQKTASEQPESLSLRINFSWTLVGNLVYAACQWGMIVAIAKLGTPSMVGRFSLGLAIAAPVFMFTNLQLRSVQASDAEGDFTFRDYLSLRVAMTILGLTAIGAFLAFSGYEPALALVIGVIALAKASESMSDVCYGLMQRHERMDLIARSMMLKGPLSLVILASVLAVSGSLLWAVVGLALTWTAIFFAYDIRNARKFFPVGASSALQFLRKVLRLHISRLRKLVVVSLPLGLVMMLVSLDNNVPKYFIEGQLGEEALGYYSALAYLMIGGMTVVNALGQSALPRLSQLYADQERRAFLVLLGKLLGIALALGLAGLGAAASLGEYILTIFYAAEYAAYNWLFIGLMGVAAALYVSSILGYGMTAMRYFKIQFPILVAAVSANVALCAWLIPSIGLFGVVWALLASTLVQILASAWVVGAGVRRANHTSIT